jgi:cytochrome c-type biogenesis protein CcmH/NrfG
MDKASLHDKLAAYLQNRLDAKEQAEVEQLIESDKAVAEQLTLVRMEHELATVLLDDKLDAMMEAWEKEEAGEESSDSADPTLDKQPPPSNNRPLFWLLGVLLAGALIYFLWPTVPAQEQQVEPQENRSLTTPSETEQDDSAPTVTAPAAEEPANNPERPAEQAAPPIAQDQPASSEPTYQQLALAMADDYSPINKLNIRTRGEQAEDEPPIVRGYYLMGKGDLKGAEEALLSVPEQPEKYYLNAQQYLAFIYYEQGDYGMAIPILEQLIERGYYNQDDMGWYLALSYLAEGDKTKGEAQLKDFLANYPTDDRNSNARTLLDKIPE